MISVQFFSKSANISIYFTKFHVYILVGTLLEKLPLVEMVTSLCSLVVKKGEWGGKGLDYISSTEKKTDTKSILFC